MAKIIINKPIRILHMIGSLEIGGSQTMVINLYKAIDRSKIQFDFIIDHSDATSLVPIVEEFGAKVYTMPTFKGTNIKEIKTAWTNFFLEHPEYKILHSHVRSYASIYIPIAKKYGLKTIIHSHSTSNGKGIKAIMKCLLQYPLRWQADYLFACSDEAGKWLFGKNATRRKNYAVIPNAIDTSRFQFNQEKRKLIRKELQIDDKFVIGTVGRLTELKNHKFLIEVFFEIYKKNLKSVLLIIGDGNLRESLELQVKKLKLENVVIFVGSKNNTQDYYQAMDVFAFPSLWEGLGIVAIEAQCSGLPCIVSERIPKSIDMKIGLVETVSLEDRKAWTDKLTQIKERHSQKEAVRRAGYDITENAKEMQSFYLKLSKTSKERKQAK